MKKVIEFNDDRYDDLYTLVSEVTSENFCNLRENNKDFKNYLEVRRKVFDESPVLSSLIAGEPVKSLSELEILNLQELIKAFDSATYIQDEGMFIKGVEYGIKIYTDLGVKIKETEEKEQKNNE